MAKFQITVANERTSKSQKLWLEADSVDDARQKMNDLVNLFYAKHRTVNIILQESDLEQEIIRELCDGRITCYNAALEDD